MQKRIDKFMRTPAVEMTVVVLILLSVAVIVAEAIFPEGHCFGINLKILGDVLTLLFIIELSLRYCGSQRARSYLREYWLDILAVMPTARVFRILRVLRLLRLFRVGKILNRRMRRFSNIFVEGATEYAFVILLLSIIILSGALAIISLEGNTNPDFSSFEKSFWWALYSLMAGEPVNGNPQSTAGKIVSDIVMIAGVTIFALLTGDLSAFMVQRLRLSMEGKTMDLEDLKDHILICGWNRAARLIIEEFQSDPTQRDRPIVIIAEREEKPHLNWQIVKPELVYFLSADYTQVAVLRRCSVEQAAIAILLADKSKARTDQDRDARTVLAAMIIEKLNSDIFTCVELLNRENETHLKMAGVEDVIVGDEYAGTIIASASRNRGGIVSMVNEVFSSKFGNQLYKEFIPKDWVGKNVASIHCQLKENYNAILVSVERANGKEAESLVNPDASLELRQGDSIVYISREYLYLNES